MGIPAPPDRDGGGQAGGNTGTRRVCAAGGRTAVPAQPFVGTRESQATHLLHRRIPRATTISLGDGILRYGRNAPAPDFSQRLTHTVSGDGNTITGQAELSRDGITWEDDLAITYQRIT